MSRKGSITHQIVTRCPGLRPGASKASKNTFVQHRNNAIRFGKWCKTNCSCQDYDDITNNIVELLNQYSSWLESEGKTASTIHTYVAGCCAAWQIPMGEVKKPVRHCYENTRSRGKKAVDQRNDAKREASPRLFDFAEKVGIRRHEYLSLRQDNLKIDESGYLCVEVQKGKGGKYQLQRLLSQDVDFVKDYFDGSDKYVFAKEEMENKIDLHAIRADIAKEAYRYYLDRLCSEPTYREQLEREIEARWRIYRGKTKGDESTDRNWDVEKVRGSYHIRGNNRKYAIANGLDTSYDRCAVMAVSVFHLSHWRCDVTIDNYLLAI